MIAHNKESKLKIIPLPTAHNKPYLFAKTGSNHITKTDPNVANKPIKPNANDYLIIILL